jgi:hypothetical protein
MIRHPDAVSQLCTPSFSRRKMAPSQIDLQHCLGRSAEATSLVPVLRRQTSDRAHTHTRGWISGATVTACMHVSAGAVYGLLLPKTQPTGLAIMPRHDSKGITDPEGEADTALTRRT